MTITAYMVGIVVMAIATITILTVGTLAAADMLHRPSAPEKKPVEDRQGRRRTRGLGRPEPLRQTCPANAPDRRGPGWPPHALCELPREASVA